MVCESWLENMVWVVDDQAIKSKISLVQNMHLQFRHLADAPNPEQFTIGMNKGKTWHYIIYLKVTAKST